MYKKIDLMIKDNDGWHYLCSTNQSKTCREAVKRFRDKYEGKKFFSVGINKTFSIKTDSKIKGTFK